MARGRFITFEGGEGAGKSTQTRRLAEWLETRGIATVVTREPGGSPGAEAIRGLLVTGDGARWDPRTETLLHFAARADHVGRTIAPALAAGRWVVCDRFLDSTIAYQGYGQGVDRAFIDALAQGILGDLRPDALAQGILGDLRPDLTLLLDLPVEVGLGRAAERRNGENRYETMDRAFHERLRRGFHEIAAADPARCVIVDATPDPETVHRQILSVVETRLLATAPR